MARIIHQTETTLDVKITPPRTLAWVLIVCGLALWWFCEETTVIQCERDAQGHVSCTILTSRFGLAPSRRVIEGVTGARVERSRGRNRATTTALNFTYRVVLITSAGESAVSGSFDNRESQHRELARGINEFIANPQPPRRQQWVLPWNRWLLFILAVPLVGGAMLRAGAARIRIDRPQDRVEVVRYMLLWRQRRELSLAEVREFRVMAKRRHGQTFYGPGFVLTDGTEMPLTHMWNSSADKHRAIIEILEAFRSPPVRPPMG